MFLGLALGAGVEVDTAVGQFGRGRLVDVDESVRIVVDVADAPGLPVVVAEQVVAAVVAALGAVAAVGRR